MSEQIIQVISINEEVVRVLTDKGNIYSIDADWIQPSGMEVNKLNLPQHLLP